jgi:hypothetical protein
MGPHLNLIPIWLFWLTSHRLKVYLILKGSFTLLKLTAKPHIKPYVKLCVKSNSDFLS